MKLKLNKEWEYVEAENFDVPTLDLGEGIKISISFATYPIADTGDYESSAYVDMHTKNGNTDTIQFIIANHVIRTLGDEPIHGSGYEECDEVAIKVVNDTIQDLIDRDFSGILQIAEVSE